MGMGIPTRRKNGEPGRVWRMQRVAADEQGRPYGRMGPCRRSFVRIVSCRKIFYFTQLRIEGDVSFPVEDYIQFVDVVGCCRRTFMQTKRHMSSILCVVIKDG